MQEHAAHLAAKHDPAAAKNRWLMPLAVSAAALTGALIVAPHILPSIGIGTDDDTHSSFALLHARSGTPGYGLAGGINSVLEAIPLIGPELAKGGLFTGVASAAVGLGGILLGRHIEKKEDGTRRFSMGKLIKTAALITSALIALPSILTGIAIGITFLCSALGDVKLASSTSETLLKTIGSSHKVDTSGASLIGAVAAMSHVGTCGSVLIPGAVSMGLLDGKHEPKEIPPGQSPDPAANKNYTDGTVRAETRLETPLITGQKVKGTLRLSHAKDGSPLSNEELAVVHTKKVHFYVVDETLKDFHHIHPTPTGTPGEFSFEFSPATSNHYSGWADVTLAAGACNHRLKTEIPGTLARPARAHITRNDSDREQHLQFQLKNDAPLRKDTAAVMEFQVSDPLGNPITDLEPVLGASAHLIGFSADGKSIIHAHPMLSHPSDIANHAGPRLRFHVEPDFAGPVQLYLQVKHHGKDVTASFGQQIFPALQTSASLAHRESAPACHR